MLSQLLTLTADLIPLMWFLNGVWHYTALNHPSDLKNIYALSPLLTDRIRLSTPTGIGDIGDLTSLECVVKNGLVSAPPVGACGFRLRLYKSDAVSMLGTKSTPFVTNLSPHQYNISIPLTGTGADVTDMILEIYSYEWGGGGSWPPGMGLIQTYQILPTLEYESVVPEVNTEMEFQVTSGDAPLIVGSGKTEMKATNGRCSMTAGSGRVELTTER